MKFPILHSIQLKLKNRNHLVLFLLLAIIGAFLMINSSFSGAADDKNLPIASPDTFIPKGYTLVPIELQNTESISSMIDDFAIVDLYANSLTDKKAHRVGSRLRLIRAPLNRDRFAVLVPDSQAGLILGVSGPISASILNSKLEGQGNLEQVQKASKLKVQYYQGGT